MKQKKDLTSPSSFGQIDTQPSDLLKQNGFKIINNPYGRKLTEDEVIELAKDCIGIVAGVEPLTKRVMDSLPNLKCISRVGVGMDSVDLDYAKQKGITVVNTPDGSTRSVAEMTIAMTFALLRRIPQADCDIKNEIWKKQTGNLLYGKIIGVIGLGRIGRMVAKMFKALGNDVIGYDLYPDQEWMAANKVKLIGLKKLLQTSNIITLHIPENSEKRSLIGKKEIAAMKKNSFLINLSRGGVVDEKSLYEALISKQIKGAAIDVFSKEPYSGNLTKLDNVVLTPHLGSYAAEGKLQMEIDAVNNLINVLKNEI